MGLVGYRNTALFSWLREELPNVGIWILVRFDVLNSFGWLDAMNIGPHFSRTDGLILPMRFGRFVKKVELFFEFPVLKSLDYGTGGITSDQGKEKNTTNPLANVIYTVSHIYVCWYWGWRGLRLPLDGFLSDVGGNFPREFVWVLIWMLIKKPMLPQINIPMF